MGGHSLININHGFLGFEAVLNTVGKGFFLPIWNEHGLKPPRNSSNRQTQFGKTTGQATSYWYIERAASKAKASMDSHHIPSGKLP